MFSKDEESLRYLLKNSGLKKGETLNFSHVKNEYHSVMKEMGEFKYTVASYSYTIDLNEKVIEKLQTEKKKHLKNEKLKNCFLCPLKKDDSLFISNIWRHSDIKEKGFILHQLLHFDNTSLRNENDQLVGWMMLQSVNKINFFFFF